MDVMLTRLGSFSVRRRWFVLVGWLVLAGVLFGDRLPWVIGGVVTASFLLLVLMFRSILVPLKAAVLTLLSIGAAYGVIVAVFQWGWGLTLIGIREPVPIMSVVPMFLFAVLFGLSMDYEVFLMSRIREDYLATGDPHRSVVTGLASTGRVVTSAAAIMTVVFLSFVGIANPLVKMVGIGLAAAVLVDATVIRMVLVPALMSLFGAAAWWLPSRRRRLPDATTTSRAPTIAAPVDRSTVSEANATASHQSHRPEPIADRVISTHTSDRRQMNEE